ncbi:MAG: hypothetical protein PHE53_13240 [Thermoguttaceae bacterium]|nr:hypothetical protein [Thermoguttaceae bacterium]
MYHSNTFWILHAVGTYEDTIGKDYDDEAAYVLGYATWSTLVYNETLRDFLATSTPTQGKVYVDILEARKRVMFHETLHYFLGPHGNTLTELGIMSGNCLYTSEDISITDSQIARIQKQPRPVISTDVIL